MAGGVSKVNEATQKPRVVPAAIFGSFVLVTILFPLWGFANDITNPMVAAFKNILLISNFESSLVQFAFYGGYCVMAIPAALFIKRFSYKTGIVLGLILYAVGCLMFIPSGQMMAFWAFLISYFVMTCGLSFLETSANPYILAMGPEETSTRRLNFAQSFNPMGSIVGMLIASQVILVNIDTITETGRRYFQDVAKGKTHHALILEHCAGDVDDINPLLNELSGGPTDGKKLKTIAGTIESAALRMKCLDAERGPLAVQMKADLDAAQKQAPNFIKLGLSKVISLPQVQASQKAYMDQMKRLKESFSGDRSNMDLTILALEEKKVISALDASLLDDTRPLLASATAAIQAMSDKVSASPQPQDMKTFRNEIQTGLNEYQASVKNLLARYETIPASAMAQWYAANKDKLEKIQQADLEVIIWPYVWLGVVVFACMVLFVVCRLPKVAGEEDKSLNVGPTLKRLFSNGKYIEGVVAQAFYVGAQIMCWTFIIQYGENELGMNKATAQNYNILGMSIFVTSRFICTFLLQYFSPGGLLMGLALGGLVFSAGTIFIQGMAGLYCLVGISACMSLMFPTIYGIALKGLGDDAKLGAAGLIMAIGGGCLMPPMQGAIMDMSAFNLGFMTLSSVRMSFVLPLICFVVIAIYGFRTSAIHKHR